MLPIGNITWDLGISRGATKKLINVFIVHKLKLLFGWSAVLCLLGLRGLPLSSWWSLIKSGDSELKGHDARN